MYKQKMLYELNSQKGDVHWEIGHGVPKLAFQIAALTEHWVVATDINTDRSTVFNDVRNVLLLAKTGESDQQSANGPKKRVHFVDDGGTTLRKQLSVQRKKARNDNRKRKPDQYNKQIRLDASRLVETEATEEDTEGDSVEASSSEDDASSVEDLSDGTIDDDDKENNKGASNRASIRGRVVEEDE